jgi:hypothetical protein
MGRQFKVTLTVNAGTRDPSERSRLGNRRIGSMGMRAGRGVSFADQTLLFGWLLKLSKWLTPRQRKIAQRNRRRLRSFR